jgi:hypothetical protein
MKVWRPASRAAGGKAADLRQHSVPITAKGQHSVAVRLVALDVDVVGQGRSPSVRRRAQTLRLSPFAVETAKRVGCLFYHPVLVVAPLLLVVGVTAVRD